ncbi:endo-beta-N-acetylglucosaminidase [Streptomyces sp. NPDC008313]|uniref:endo-beta-N-acetylglucosaminidase n=1 Tax=Streptomyces sp. NPDC008313 TaxID=3364826 RepID=UPI0036E2A664
MKPSRRTLLLSAATAAAGLVPGLSDTAAAAARDLQPYASYWYPDSLPAGTPGPGITWRSLADWSTDTDADLPFNAARVPLADRFTPTPVNPIARAGQARVQSLVSFGPTAGNRSQGAPTADYYALTHWAYIDELVFWGGSSGEGLILAPNAPVVDAAHRHGVPVLGNVFLPPAAYGGQLQWTRDLVRRDAAGHYPLAGRLVEVAAAYGFDGWFVNAETGGGDPALATGMLGFLDELRSLGAARGQRVTWYDAMTVDGTVSWQGALDDRNSAFFETADSMFVDFRWSAGALAFSAATARRLGGDPYELWAGVDVEAAGTAARVDWDAVVPTGRDHVVSVGFYRPEWTRNHLPAGHTPGDFHAADDLFWTGATLDPATADPGARWRAPAVSVADRSTVASVPFATVFNTGHGLKWYEDGEVTSDTAWNHLGLQDRLPSRRWVVRTTGRRPSVAFDFADAWRGGSSLLVDGDLDGPVTLDLYATRLPLGPATVAELTHRAEAGDVTVELAVATAEPGAPGEAPPYTYLPLTPGGRGRGHGRDRDPVGDAAGWLTSRVRVARLSGTVHALGVRITPAAGTERVRLRLGRLAVRDRTVTPAAPSGLRITDADGGGFRFRWHGAPGHVRHYALHRVLPDGTRRFLGGTCQTAFYAGGLAPEQGERAARFDVRAVGELFTVSSPSTTTHTW